MAGITASPVPGGFRANDSNSHATQFIDLVYESVPVIELDANTMRKDYGGWIFHALGFIDMCVNGIAQSL